jgi:hypothetical protein
VNRKRKDRTRRSHERGEREKQILQRIHLNAASIDIGSESHWVAVPEDRDPSPVREFRSFTQDLHALADWLEACGIDTVAMESTGVYWIPLYEILEDRGVEVLLVNARHVKSVPGRKSAFAPTNALISALMTGTTFDTNRLNIAMDPALTSHSSTAAFPNELMDPVIPRGLRRPITLYPAASLPAREINDDISMKYVDGGNTGTEDGTADFPWSTPTEAVASEPANTPLLMIPGTYTESPLAITEAHIIQAANGSDVVVD